MKQLRLYLDTSIISYLYQSDVPEKEKSTNLFWDKVKSDIYDIFISDITLRELNECPEPKRSLMLEKLAEIKMNVISIDDEMINMVKKILDLKILTDKSKDDCFHISAAMVTGCDYLLSWNFKHLVNIRTINGVRAIASLNGYSSIDIITPEFLLDWGD